MEYRTEILSEVNTWCHEGLSIINFGLLYNWFAAASDKNIAADGWHVPTDTEYNTLYTYLSENQGGKLKEVGTEYWIDPNTGATNFVGFDGRGAGDRGSEGFDDLKEVCVLWTATEENVDNAWVWFLHNYDSSFSHGLSGAPKIYGYTIRLIKDSTILSHGETGTYTGNDGKVYNTICIGSQEWLASNLTETKYRDDTTIPEVTDQVTWSALSSGALCAYNNDWGFV